MRNISLLLRPSLLDDLGLLPALQWQAEEFSRRTGIPCELIERLGDDSLPTPIKTCVYRVTQEALRNCEKHSRATRVRISVDCSGAQLQVCIDDDGVGFPASAERRVNQLGLLGMRERAAALAGRLVTENRPGGGASVRLVLPVEAGREMPVPASA